MKVTFIPIVIGAINTVTEGLVKGLEGLGDKRMSGVHPNYSIIKVNQNTEKSPGDLRRLAVTQTPVKDAEVKNSQEVNNNKTKRSIASKEYYFYKF